MSKYNRKQIMGALRVAGVHLYLYVIFFVILYYFGLGVLTSSTPAGYTFVSLTTVGCVLVYSVINHIVIKKTVGLKTVILFETILVASLLVLTKSCIDYRNIMMIP